MVSDILGVPVADPGFSEEVSGFAKSSSQN